MIDNRCKLYCIERKTEIKVLPELLYVCAYYCEFRVKLTVGL